MYLGTVRISFIRKLHHRRYLACFRDSTAAVWGGTREASAAYDTFLTSERETAPKLALIMGVGKEYK